MLLPWRYLFCLSKLLYHPLHLRLNLLLLLRLPPPPSLTLLPSNPTPRTPALRGPQSSQAHDNLRRRQSFWAPGRRLLLESPLVQDSEDPTATSVRVLHAAWLDFQTLFACCLCCLLSCSVRVLVSLLSASVILVMHYVFRKRNSVHCSHVAFEDSMIVH